PLSAATFATLDSGMRAQGTALYSLVRNIGSSIGISIVQTLLVRNTQVAHSSLAEHISRTNPALQSPSLIEQLHLHTQAGFMQLNQIVTRQAAMIAYVDDFWLMMVLTLMAMPLLVLMKQPTHPPSKTESAEAMVME
ncbi:MAG TPA: EmrB/QacA family drug resistance transporter, partial [Limnobacter sp.]|nr:EmrB/QacA family drug resistance transporter [Limnobacter sp.]